MKIKTLAVAALSAMISAASFAQVNFSTLADGSGNLTATVTILDASNTYILDRKIYVTDGKTLNIPAGTVVKANVGQGNDAPALIVCRGAKIYALGTKEDPIIFTTIEDDLSGEYSAVNKERWGGIIVLGEAYNNVHYLDENPEAEPEAQIGIANGESYIEGLDYPDVRHHYGARTRIPDAPDGVPQFIDDDNSGVIRYVSIRHGGSEIGVANEINGLTLGSVGSKTILEHIEVVSNGDDGIEFFGGTANLRYATIAFCEDDYIDWDQGYKGKIQFVYGVQLPSTTVGGSPYTAGDNGMECDGNDFDDRSSTSNPVVSNVTIIGHAGSGDKGLELKEETRGEISNAIIAGFDIPINVDVTGADAVTFSPDSMDVRNSLFLNCGAPTGVTQVQVEARSNSFVTSTSVIDDVLELTTVAVDTFYHQTVINTVNPVPAAGDANIATDYIPAMDDDFFTYAPYKGAFEPGVEPWTKGWTVHSDMGTDKKAVDCPTDVDGDGVTNFNDVVEVGAQYNQSCAVD